MAGVSDDTVFGEREMNEYAIATTTADSSAALRNDNKRRVKARARMIAG